MSRLIHYSKTPLKGVYSRPHIHNDAGVYKTPGLWISAEGEDDWPSFCYGEGFRTETLAFATEIILSEKHNVLWLRNADHIDRFSEHFWDSSKLNWAEIRERWRGLIIAPYCWERRLTDHTSWYYGWDCASGVIWDADAVHELRPVAMGLPQYDLANV